MKELELDRLGKEGFTLVRGHPFSGPEPDLTRLDVSLGLVREIKGSSVIFVVELIGTHLQELLSPANIGVLIAGTRLCLEGFHGDFSLGHVGSGLCLGFQAAKLGLASHHLQEGVIQNLLLRFELLFKRLDLGILFQEPELDVGDLLFQVFSACFALCQTFFQCFFSSLSASYRVSV